MLYDIIIVGAGISGLYAAHRIQTISPKTSILILEQSSATDLGGRTGNRPFQGTSITIGAGIGRKTKDVLLYNLLQEYRIPTHTFLASSHYASTIPGGVCDVKGLFTMLKKKYTEEIEKRATPMHKTFREFAEPILGKELYQTFTICAGYTDYENEDVQDTLYHYGFEDNYEEWIGFSVSWTLLVQAMANRLQSNGGQIQTLRKVTRIDPNKDMFCITTRTLGQQERTQEYLGKRVIVATTIQDVMQILPGASSDAFPYKQIHGQPFLRIYGRFTKACLPIVHEFLQKTTVIPGPLHKVIPINQEKGVYMIAYTDNQGANTSRILSENTPENRETLCRILERSLGIKRGLLELRAIQSWYWSIGTHYYEPLRGPWKTRRAFIRAAQRPMPGLLVVGEMISMHQGWVEGALESVEAVVTNKWITQPKA